MGVYSGMPYLIIIHHLGVWGHCSPLPRDNSPAYARCSPDASASTFFLPNATQLLRTLPHDPSKFNWLLSDLALGTEK